MLNLQSQTRNYFECKCGFDGNRIDLLVNADDSAAFIRTFSQAASSLNPSQFPYYSNPISNPSILFVLNRWGLLCN